MKTCTKCKETKQITQFNYDKRRKDKLTCHCKSCVAVYSKQRNGTIDRDFINAQSKRWKQNNPDKLRAMALKTIFNLAYDKYLEMLKEQNYSCAICNCELIPFGPKEDSHKIANVDHCHTTGVIRGLLCRKCNTAIGLLQDNPIIIENASLYLKRKSNEC